MSPGKQSDAGETERNTPFGNKSAAKSPPASKHSKKNSNAGSKLQEQRSDATATPVLEEPSEAVDDRKDLLKKIGACKKIKEGI